jgi:TrmH family RNA methyltransferase
MTRLTKNEIKYLCSLTKKKYRQQEHKFLLEGWRGLEDALAANASIEYVAVESARLENPDYSQVLRSVAKKKIEIREISTKELEQVSSTVHSQGIISVVRIAQSNPDDMLDANFKLIVMLDAIADPGNLGTIIRTSDWFGTGAVVLGKGCVELHNEKVVRSAAGSLFHMPIVEGIELPDVIKRCSTQGYTLVGLAAEGDQPIDKMVSNEKIVFILGNEGNGLSDEVRQCLSFTTRIPKYGMAESLNVGVACAIALSSYRTKQEQPPR